MGTERRGTGPSATGWDFCIKHWRECSSVVDRECICSPQAGGTPPSQGQLPTWTILSSCPLFNLLQEEMLIKAPSSWRCFIEFAFSFVSVWLASPVTQSALCRSHVMDSGGRWIPNPFPAKGSVVKSRAPGSGMAFSLSSRARVC